MADTGNDGGTAAGMDGERRDDSEIELKLLVDPSDLGRLEALPELKAGMGRAKTLESVYYDTQDLALRRRDVTFRVRRQGRRYVQTVKAAREVSTGLSSRGEWEMAVGGAEPDLAALAGGPAGRHLGPVATGELRPLFTSRIRRRTNLLDGGALGEGAAVEVAIDRGEIRTADGAVLPVSEVELELKRGGRRVLFELALKLAEAVPVRVETRTKSDRGYALAAGDRPAAVKAKRIGFEGDETVEQAFDRIARGCIAHLVANEACAADGRDLEGIHQMRVALRRLRSALSVFRSVLPDDQRAWFTSEARWLTGELGPARDWDVFLSDLLRPVDEALPEDPALSALRTAVSEARDGDYAKVRAAIASRRYAMLLLRAGAWVEARSWRRQDLSEEAARLFSPVRGLADALLEKRHRAVRKRGRRFERLSSEDRHELRIALKKLRYACEFFRSLYDDKPVRRYLKQLVALQDDLGHLNDVSTASKLLDALTRRSGGREGTGRCAGAGMVVGWHARGLHDLEPELVADWNRFARTAVFWSRKPA